MVPIGKGSGLGLIAILGLALVFSQRKVTNGIGPILVPQITREFHYRDVSREVQILRESRETLTFHKERLEHFRSVSDRAEEALEEIEEDIVQAKTLQEKIFRIQKGVKGLKKMVQPTTTFDPRKLTQADLDKAKALAERSRPAYGVPGIQVPN